jgi:aspartyl/asparaginyl beta-hydroxylase (cupin superfamily)
VLVAGNVQIRRSHVDLRLIGRLLFEEQQLQEDNDHKVDALGWVTFWMLAEDDEIPCNRYSQITKIVRRHRLIQTD